MILLPLSVPDMKSFKRRIRELDERPIGQILAIELPGIEPLILAEWLANPTVQSWALAMTPSERHNAIQQAIDGKLAEVKNIA